MSLKHFSLIRWKLLKISDVNSNITLLLFQFPRLEARPLLARVHRSTVDISLCFSAACSAWRLPRPVFPQSFTAPARHLLFKSPPTQRQIAHHRRRPARRVGTTRFSPTCVGRIRAGRCGEYIWYLFLRHLMMDVIWISFLEYQ